MDQFLPGFITLAAMLTGVWMLLWPAEAALNSRDDREDPAPVSPAEIWQMRVVGLLLIAGGAYGLYAVVTKLPGAEFIGV